MNFRAIVLFTLAASLLLENSNAERLRVALPRVFDTRSGGMATEARACLGLYLRERLSECESVHLIRDARLWAIFGELKSGKRDGGSQNLFEEFNRYMPVDVLVDAIFTDEEILIQVSKKDGSHELRIPVKEKFARQAVRTAAAFVAGEFGLSGKEKAILTEERITDPGLFHNYYVCHVHSVQWPNNSGEARLKKLRPYWSQFPDDARLAGRVLEDTEVLFRSAVSRVMDYAKTGGQMGQYSVEKVLGTPWERSADAVVIRMSKELEPDLLELAGAVAKTETDALEESFEEAETGERPEEVVGLKAANEAGIDGATNKKSKATKAQRLGALRLLGVAKSSKGLPLMLTASRQKEAAIREAAAFSLAASELPESKEPLRKLMKDEALDVAFQAALGLPDVESESEAVLALARKVAALPDSKHRQDAMKLLSKKGTKEDIDLLLTLTSSAGQDTRYLILKRALDEGKFDAAQTAEYLNDPDDRVVVAAAASVGEKPSVQIVDALKRLTNDPLLEVAGAARLALAPHRPKTGREQRLFDLAIEHTYLRMKIIRELAAMRDEVSLTELEAACSNQDEYARVLAIELLMNRDPRIGLPHLLKAIHDPYRLVRLKIAPLLAEHAGAEHAKLIQAAADSETDKAVELYLRDTLARVRGVAPPPALPAAHSVQGKRNLSWLCGMGSDPVNSPFDAYYLFSTTLGETGKAAHDAGKIIFSRIETVGNPGMVMVDPVSRDNFRGQIDAALPPDVLPYIDGLVFGEETMNADPGALWPAGWRLFCLDAGIDPERIKGDIKTLSTIESRAWHYWAMERVIDGFNELYDYVKLKYGKLRPGMQVCTFLPEQGLMGAGPNPADLRWKFDVGGIYHYKGCTRLAAYDLVRRYKTLWPERPILWLSLGIGGYEMNPVKRTQQVPISPMTSRGHRAYADTITAYLAGADTGFFSVWIFVDKNFRGSMHQLSGVQIVAEDLFPGSKLLDRAIEFSFRGAEKDYELAKETPDAEELANAAEPGVDPDKLEENEVVLETEEDIAEKKKIPMQVKADKERFNRGFLYYGKHVKDCVRLFNSLPRRNPEPQALAIRNGISVWSNPRRATPLVPAQALLNEYDYLCDINKTAKLDLSRYRLIVSHDPSLLTDATIGSITKWLKEFPGLLIVHRDLTADNSREASTPDDLDGRLRNDWPWEEDVQVNVLEAGERAGFTKIHAGKDEMATTGEVASQLKLAGTRAEALFTKDGSPILVLWRAPDFKGAVLFDAVEYASQDYLKALRTAITDIRERHGIGLKLDKPILHQSLSTDTLTAASATRYFSGVSEKHVYPGIDLLTGVRNPSVGGGMSGAVIAENFTGKYIASHSGIAVLSEAPLLKVERAGDEVIVQSKGLIRASCISGELQVAPFDGADLEEVKEPMDWIVYGNEEGFARVPVGKDGETLTFLRCDRPVRLKRVDR
ncbi:MAG: hypothetical protein O2857_04560 [Planctomycetota bacterium]|nr:hypothetical protein [Planctomycetota bacterium]